MKRAKLRYGARGGGSQALLRERGGESRWLRRCRGGRAVAGRGAAGEGGGFGGDDDVRSVVGARLRLLTERQPVGFNLQRQRARRGGGRGKGRGEKGEKGTGDDSRMSSLDAWKIKGNFPS